MQQSGADMSFKWERGGLDEDQCRSVSPPMPADGAWGSINLRYVRLDVGDY